MGLFKKNRIEEENEIVVRKKPIGIVVLLLVAILLTFWGVKVHKDYLYYKEIVVPITATITDIDEVDDDGDTDYKMYVSYSYNGVNVRNIHWKTLNNRTKSIGDQVTIMIAPNEPDYVFKGRTGLVFFCFALIVLAFVLQKFTSRLHLDKDIGNSDILQITEYMVADDLKPSFRMFVSKSMVFIGFALFIGYIFIPELFGLDSKKIGVFLIEIGTVILLTAWISIKKIPKKDYELYIDKCLKQWSEGSGDDETHYTRFENLGKVLGNHGIVGKRYYIVKNNRNKLCGIYDTQYWQPAVEDASLINGSKTVIKNLFTDIGIAILSSAIYVGVIYASIVKF